MVRERIGQGSQGLTGLTIVWTGLICSLDAELDKRLPDSVPGD